MSISFNTVHTDTSYSSIRRVDSDPRFKKIEAGASENYLKRYSYCYALTFLAGFVAMLACGILALQGNLLGVSEGGAYAMAIIGGLGIPCILIDMWRIPGQIKEIESQKKRRAKIEADVEEIIDEMEAENTDPIDEPTAKITQRNINEQLGNQTQQGQTRSTLHALN